MHHFGKSFFVPYALCFGSPFLALPSIISEGRECLLEFSSSVDCKRFFVATVRQ